MDVGCKNKFKKGAGGGTGVGIVGVDDRKQSVPVVSIDEMGEVEGG